MKKSLFLALIFLCAAATASIAQNNEIFEAMNDELSRSMTTVKKDNFAKPYYISYTVYDIDSRRFDAQRGSSVFIRNSSFMQADIMMRVGSEQEDNSYFENPPASFTPTQEIANGYNALRFALWGATDQVYKDALAQLAKKEAFKKSNNLSEKLKDFSSATAASVIEKENPPAEDDAYWQKAVQELSAQGAVKDLDNFTASITITHRPVYFLNTEGAKYFKDESLIRISINAYAKAQDGFDINEAAVLSYSDIKDIPSLEKLKETAAKLVQKTIALSKAQKVQPYVGPVLLEKGAAASLFDTMFKRNIINTKPILYSDNSKDRRAGDFAQKKGLKIISANFTVIDDPLLKAFNGQALAGHFAVDSEGVAAQKLQLVKSGILIDLPTTRSLIKEQKTSNGHARAPYANGNMFARAGIGNLMFLPHNTVPEQDLKTVFMQYCKEEGLKYCYIIRDDLDYSTIAVYQINAETGEETPFYGAAAPNITPRSLRDIKYASDDLAVYNYPPFEDFGYSIIAPSVILSEIELSPTQKTPAQKPLLKKPI